MNTLEQAIDSLRQSYEALLKQSLAEDDQIKSISPIHKAAALARLQWKEQRRVSVNIKFTEYKAFTRALRHTVQEKLRQKTITSQPPIRSITFYYARSLFFKSVLDELVVNVVTQRQNIREERIGTISGAAGVTAENAAKPLMEPSITSISTQFQKIALTGTVTDEVLLSHPDFEDFLIWYSAHQIENSLHLAALAALVANAQTFTVTSQGLPQPRIVDLIEFMRRNYNLNPYRSDGRPWEATGAVIPQGYWAALTIIQDGVGSDRNAQKIADLAIIPHTGPNTSYSLVFSENDLGVYIIDDILFEMNRVVESSDDRNLVRYTAEVHYNFIPRANASLIVSDTQAAIAALT